MSIKLGVVFCWFFFNKLIYTSVAAVTFLFQVAQLMSWPLQFKTGLLPSSQVQALPIALLVSWTRPRSRHHRLLPVGTLQLVAQPSLDSCCPPLAGHYLPRMNGGSAAGASLNTQHEGRETRTLPGLLPYCSLGFLRRKKHVVPHVLWVLCSLLFI